ncbi:glycosyl hydrolase family 61-domain-containing protein [Irpex rosettiformis]|uniref:Glycosyl hydrolase family 61-domain-containing protein n=1 Tax=Irpex rosettiformis TaxID=378272 RepID=A0ACB8U5T7_9APHY|nr:glycosyl hydrolase family 61-domain-containing protein [Irpex rosettiformis]
MQLLPSILFALALFAEQASAHGYVNQIAVDGKWYPGNKPGSDSQLGPSPIRLISDGGPLQLQGSEARDFVCGKNASKAQMTVPANTSSLVTFNWVGMDGASAWIHHAGPVITYMTSCGSQSCDAFDATVDTKWFKVAQLGQLPNDTGRWFQEGISSERTYVFQLPDQLAPGGYLIRHELISLQNAVAPNGIEFYPMCLQVNVSSEGQQQPNTTVTFPAIYNSSTDGLIFDTYTPPVPAYPFPGGPLSNVHASGQGLGPTAPSLSAIPTTSQTDSASDAPQCSVAPPEKQGSTSSAVRSHDSQPPNGRCLVKRNTGRRAAHNAGLRRAW